LELTSYERLAAMLAGTSNPPHCVSHNAVM
jgi:hypothetical protein